MESKTKKIKKFENPLFNKFKKKLFSSTYKSLSKQVLNNAKFNSKLIKKGHSIKEIKNFRFNKNTNIALIVSGGPSLRKKNHLTLIKKNQSKAIIICTDGSLFYLLENNILPDLIVTLDPHPTRIVRWFGDTNLKTKTLKKDNYFRKQDIDIKFRNEININKKVIKLTNIYGRKLNIATCTSSSKKVVKRIIQMNSKIYWWNPFMDDVKNKKSITRKIYNLNKLPILNSGGNVGSACWMIADSVINCKVIGMIGMDLSYYNSTKVQNTQYYELLKKNFGRENIKFFYKKIYNPIYKKFFYTDYVYDWYREILSEMILYSKNITVNCTEGGILFGKKIINISLKKFFKKYY